LAAEAKLMIKVDEKTKRLIAFLPLELKYKSEQKAESIFFLPP